MPIGILAYNISEYNIIKRTPFFINKGFKADVLLKIRKYKKLVLHIVIKVEKIYELQNKLQQNLIFFNKVMKKLPNKKRI